MLPAALAMTVAAPVLAQSPRAPGAARGDSAAAKPAAATASDEIIQQYSIPESPAFVFLNTSPAKITRPTTPRELVTSLLNAIDDQGRVRQGLAIEGQPSAIFRPVSLDAYQRRGLAYAAANLQLSLGTVRTSGDSSSTDLAYGARVTLYDGADPMADRAFTDSLVADLRQCQLRAGPPPFPLVPDTSASGRIPDSTMARRLQALEAFRDSTVRMERESELAACNRAAIETRDDRYALAHWNALHLAAAYAHGSRLSAAATATRDLGDRVWLVAGAPLGSVAQVLGFGQWSNTVLDAAPRAPSVESWSYGARVLLGKSTFTVFAELISESRHDPPVGVSRSAHSWSGGVEFRLAEQLWLATGFGRDGDVSGSGPTLVIADLRWGISNKARYR
jgi:hypothetical protein